MPDRPPHRAVIVVLVTCPNRKIGKKVGQVLVKEWLAACVNVVPGLTSIYRWEGKIRQEAEVLLIIKTHRSRLQALIRRVTALHPYSTPEIIALPLVGGSTPYVTWVQDSSS